MADASVAPWPYQRDPQETKMGFVRMKE